MADLIDRDKAIDAICKNGTNLERDKCYVISIATAKQRAVDIICDLPSVQPEIIRCKDCVKHNRDIGDFKDEADNKNRFFWKDEACPLVRYRGKAQGHEFDYQYCCYAERRTDG